MDFLARALVKTLNFVNECCFAIYKYLNFVLPVKIYWCCVSHVQ